MKYLFKVILLFLIVFKIPVPPIYDSCVIAVIMAALYYLFVKGVFPYAYFTSRYCLTILISTLFMAIIDLINLTLHGNLGEGLFNRFMVQGWMILCVVFILPILIEKGSTAYNEAMSIICGAFALQGLIHTLGVFVTPVGNIILSITHNQDMAGVGFLEFRYYSLTGSPFFELPAAYGVACIMFFRLQLIPDQNYLRGWKAFVIMFWILMGITLSGRTGFVGFSLGLLLYIVYKWYQFSQILKNIIKISFGFLCLLIIFNVALKPQQRNLFINNIFPFAFELYYSLRDTGKFRTDSTDALEQVHYYPLDSNTIMWGDGGFPWDFPSKYRHTDAGYMAHIILGGIFYLLALILYQFIFFWEPMIRAKLENSMNGKINFFCFFLLFAYMFILEYKGSAIGVIHIMEALFFYIGISYLVEQYALEDIKETQEEGLYESTYA